MTTAAKQPLKSKLCSVLSREYGEDPGGSAPSWDRCLIVEVAKPWKFEVAESSHFPAGVSEALDRAEKAGKPARLQCVSPDPEYSQEGRTRVMLFSRPSGPLMTYSKVDYLVPSDQVGRLAHALLVDSDAVDEFAQHQQEGVVPSPHLIRALRQMHEAGQAAGLALSPDGELVLAGLGI